MRAPSLSPGSSRAATIRHLRWLLGLILGVAFLWLLWSMVDVREVAALIARAAWLPLLGALVAFAADFVLRAVRFWMMLVITSRRDLPLRPTIAPFIASFGISDILPLRLGDAFRVYWFHRRFGLPVGTLIGTMLIERLLDLATIILIAGVALWASEPEAPDWLIAQMQLAFAIAFAASCAVLFTPSILSRLAAWSDARFKAPLAAKTADGLRAIAAAVRTIGSWRRIAALAFMSSFLWLLESLVMIGAWVSLGAPAAEWLKPLLAFAVSVLGTLVPALPGHFGSFEYFGVQAFAINGIAPSYAAAVILLAHLILWAPTALFGVIWLLRQPNRWREPKTAP